MDYKLWTMLSLLLILVVLPHAVGDKAHDGQGGGGEVKNAGIQSAGGLFAQLLGGAGANGALRHQVGGKDRKHNQQE